MKINTKFLLVRFIFVAVDQKQQYEIARRKKAIALLVLGDDSSFIDAVVGPGRVHCSPT